MINLCHCDWIRCIFLGVAYELSILQQLQSMSNTTFQIKLDQTNRRIIPNLLPKDQQITERWIKKLKKTGQLMLVPTLNPSVRVFEGPKSNIKIIVLFRIYSIEGVGFYSFVSINLIDMDADLLQTENIFEGMELLSTKIRNVAVHPNGKQLIILSEVKVGKYQLRQLVEDGRTYELVLVKQKKFNDTSYDDLQYHPSGKYLVGIKQHKNKTELLPMKLDPQSLEFTTGKNIKDKCIQLNPLYYKFLVKWLIGIDRNQPSRAAIGFRMDTVCLWDLQTQNFTIQQIKLDKNLYNFSKRNSDFQVSQNINIAGISYLNSTKDGYLVGFDPTRRLSIILDQYNGTSEDSFEFSPDANVYASVSCIEIDDINSFACFRENTIGIPIVKRDVAINRTVNLYVNQQLQKGVFGVEAAFYYSKSSQFCRIFNQGLECFKIYTKCVPKNILAPINECQTQCLKQNQNSFWNPVTMSCEQCKPTCKCTHPHQTFNPYYRSCVIDCSKIPFASPSSAYANHTKCVCQRPYEWFDGLSQCRVNCSKVKFSLRPQNTSKFGISQCGCPPNFIYSPKLNSNDIAGECILHCPNGNSPLYNHNNQPYCACKEKHKWDANRYSCVKQKQHQESFPVWAIVLILIGVFILVAGVAFLIRRRCMKNKIQQIDKKNKAEGDQADNNNQVGQPSSRKLSNKQSKTRQETSEEQICAVCKKEQSRVNCRAPCGHYFHFFCIKTKIDEGESECPQCFKVLHKGVGDLQFVQHQDEIITISDTDN